MVLVKIMVTVLLLDPRSIDTFTLPKSVAAHASSLIVAALLVWLLARHGRSILLWSPPYVAAGAVLLTFALATPFALDRTVALFGVYRRYLGLTQMLDDLLLYVAVGVLFRTPRSLRLLLGVIVGTAVPVFVYALIQRLGLDPLKFNVSTLIPIGTIGNPDIAGAYFAMVGITALGVAFLFADRMPRAALAALAVIGLACVVGFAMTNVRGGLLGLAGGWLGILVLSLVLPGRRWRAGVLGIGAVVAVAVAVSPVAGRLNVGRFGSDPSVLSRFEIWGTALKTVLDRPLLGVGPDNFAVFYPANRAAASVALGGGALENSTHDVWMYVATSSGLLGLVVFVAFVAMLIERAIRMARRGEPGALALIPLLAYLGQSLVGVNEIVVDWVFWLSAGIIAATGARTVPVPRARSAAPRRARFVGIVSLAAASVLILLTLPSRIVAGEAMLASDAYAAAGRSGEAIPYGETAVQADPRRGETWSSAGTSLNDARDLVGAVRAFATAARIQPSEPLNWQNLALVWSQLGNPGAALAAAERAVQADPFDGDAQEIVATISYADGDYAKAAAAGEKAIAFRLPPQVSTYFTTVSAYVHLKDLARAEAIARDGVKRYPVPLLELQLAAIRADRGDKAEALSIVDSVLQADPKNADAQTLKRALEGQ